MRSPFLLLAFAALAFVGCGSSDDAASPNASTRKVSAAKSESNKSLPSPCDLVSTETLAEVFSVPLDKIKEDTFGSKETSCSWSWEKPNAAEIEEKNAAYMQEYFVKQREALANGEEMPKMELIDAEASVFVNFRVFDNADMASRAFDANIERLRKGVTGEHEGVKATFKIDYDTQVDGVPDKAVWSSKSKQLAVQHANVMWYVTVKSHDDTDLENAKKVIAAIQKKL